MEIMERKRDLLCLEWNFNRPIFNQSKSHGQSVVSDFISARVKSSQNNRERLLRVALMMHDGAESRSSNERGRLFDIYGRSLQCETLRFTTELCLKVLRKRI